MYPIEKSLRGYKLAGFVVDRKVTYYRFEEDYRYHTITIYIYPEENYRSAWFATDSRGKFDDSFDNKDEKLLEDTINQIVEKIKNRFEMEKSEKVKEVHKDLTDKLGDVGVVLHFAEPLVNDYFRSELRKKLKDAGCYDEKTDSFIYPIEAIREFKVCLTEGHIVIN